MENELLLVRALAATAGKKVAARLIEKAESAGVAAVPLPPGELVRFQEAFRGKLIANFLSVDGIILGETVLDELTSIASDSANEKLANQNQ